MPMLSKALAWWQTLLLLLVGTYGVFCTAMAWGQRRLIYFPQRLDAEAARAAYQFYGVERWPADGECRGAVLRSDGGVAPTNGTVLVFHGNAGGAHEREFVAKTLQRLGWRVVLAEYPGYGPRPGAPSEASFSEDGRATARLVRKMYPGRLVVLGESLGSGTAAAVAADAGLKVDAVVLAVPFDCLANVGARHYPWLPVKWLLRDRFDNVESLRNYPGPVTLVQAEDDSVVPAECTRALFEALPHADRKRLICLPYTGHCDWFWPLTDAQWREMLSR